MTEVTAMINVGSKSPTTSPKVYTASRASLILGVLDRDPSLCLQKLDSPSEKTSSSAVQTEGRLHGSPSESSSSGASHCRLLLIQARRRAAEDGLSITLVYRDLGHMMGLELHGHKDDQIQEIYIWVYRWCLVLKHWGYMRFHDEWTSM